MSFDGKSWTSECSINFHRAGATAVSVKGSVYIFGGYSNQRFENRTERYVDGCWKHDMQKDQLNNRSEACTMIIGENVFLLGGRDTRPLRPRLSRLINSVDAINIRTNQWKKVAPLNDARMNFAASTVRDVIYVFGGCSHSKQPFNSCEFLDTSTENATWTTLPYAPDVLNYATSFVLSNDEIIVLGGQSTQLCCFSTRTHTWKDTFTNCQQEQEKLGEAVISSRIFGFIM
uniref:Kelch-like protein 5 n=1 Tax=Phallusia mammillata TaxID=59560 RepID=A0A6F9DFI1_9ASCI|nr:kelch-like protein 5 [Phallusia mammillata]